MKIALFERHIQRRWGTGLVNCELVDYLAHWGHQITLLTSAVEPDLLALEGVTWRLVREPEAGPFLLRECCFLASATRVLAKLPEYDVVHLNGAIALGPHTTNTCHFCHSAAPPTAASGQVARAYHRLYRRYNAWLERRVYRQATRKVLAVSEKVRRELIEQAGIEADKVAVIHNGVDLSIFHNRDRAGERRRLCAEWNLPPEAFLLLFAGDVRTPRKGLPKLLEAMGLLQNPTAYLLVAGGKLPPEWAAMVEDSKLQGRVREIGFRSDLDRIMRGVDAFVFPSLYEPFGLVVIQAMGTGCPLIVSPAQYCGASELLTHGESAYLLDDPTDAGQIAQAIEVLGADPEFRSRLSRSARAVAEEYTWERMARRYEEVFLSHE